MSIDLGGWVLGVREGVIVLISLVAIYMLFVLLRMRRLRKIRALAAASPLAAGPESPEQLAASGMSSGAGGGADEVWESVPSRLGEEVLHAGLEQEVGQLREELEAVRSELAALRQDMLQEIAHMRATQSVSPIYGDAMQMAAAGYEPAMIAERCGIARAEAELVVALTKSQERGGE